MTAQAQANWRDLLPTHSWPSSGGGPVHGDMTGRDWGGNPVSGLPVHEWPSKVAQTHSIPVIPYGDTAKGRAHNFLGGFVDKLKEIWNRPIMAPTITKDEHERMIRGEDTGPNNWDPRY